MIVQWVGYLLFMLLTRFDPQYPYDSLSLPGVILNTKYGVCPQHFWI